MERGTLSRRRLVKSGIVGVAGFGMAGCVDTRPAPLRAGLSTSGAYGFDASRPFDLAPENLTKITVCLRPFRPSGPRLEAQRIGDKTLVHNYGHGGSGWSLAWGYAEAVRALAAPSQATRVSVLGGGAIGLTTAIAMAETGAKVTVFAKEFPMESASAKATGVWSPSSRIAFSSQVAPGFAERWEVLARRSYARHLRYVGRAGHPVEFTPRFYVRSAAPEPELVSEEERARRFLHLDRSLRGLAPPWTARAIHPFPTQNGVGGGLVMTFNIAEYLRQLQQDFLAMGGQIVRAELTSESDIKRLPGSLIVNCAGYGAKALFGDDSLVPVRGQIAWMAPQTDRLYGVHHRGVIALSRRDGLLIQEGGGSEFYGYAKDNKAPDRAEFLGALSKIAPIMEW